MYEVFVPIRADGETAELIDSLVASGFMEEAVTFNPDERCFRVTAKGTRFLSKTEELTGMVNRTPATGSTPVAWDVN